MEKDKWVNNMATLRALQKHCGVVFHEYTGIKSKNKYNAKHLTVYYVKDAPVGEFTWNGRTFYAEKIWKHLEDSNYFIYEKL